MLNHKGIKKSITSCGYPLTISRSTVNGIYFYEVSCSSHHFLQSSNSCVQNIIGTLLNKMNKSNANTVRLNNAKASESTAVITETLATPIVSSVSSTASTTSTSKRVYKKASLGRSSTRTRERATKEVEEIILLGLKRSSDDVRIISEGLFKKHCTETKNDSSSSTTTPIVQDGPIDEVTLKKVADHFKTFSKDEKDFILNVLDECCDNDHEMEQAIAQLRSKFDKYQELNLKQVLGWKNLREIVKVSLKRGRKINLEFENTVWASVILLHGSCRCWIL
jgi:hypothetical protein